MLDASQPQAVAVDRTGCERSAADASSAALAVEDRSLADRRHRRLVVFAGCFLVFALVVLLVPMPFRGRLWNQISNLLHIPAFAMINYLALSMTRYHIPSRWRVPLLVTFAVVAFSALIEVLQGVLGRNASLGDLFSNAMGASAALMLHQSRWISDSARARWAFCSFALLLAALGTLRPGVALLKMAWERSPLW